MTQYYRWVAGAGLLILILASTMPWLTVSVLGGKVDLSLADVYRSFFSGDPNANFESINQFGTSMFISALIFYPLSILLIIGTIIRREASLGAGLSCIICGSAWLFAVDSIESQRVGLFGLSFLNITLGYGAYLPFVASFIVFIVYVLKR